MRTVHRPNLDLRIAEKISALDGERKKRFGERCQLDDVGEVQVRGAKRLTIAGASLATQP